MPEAQATIYVGIDVSKDKLAVAIATGERRDEVLSLGTFENTPGSVAKLLKKLSGRGNVSVCYEAGPTGYGLYRQVRAFGHDCCVVAPSLIPVRAGERVKTDRLDAMRLARLLRAGELTPVWVPDETHEAMRDLVRARESAAEDQRHKRQLISAFVLRHGRTYQRTKPWTMRYRRWLQSLAFDHPAHQIALQEMLQAERNATERLERLTGHIEALVPEWDLAPAVNALQALRGVALIRAVTFMAEIGDVRRFETPVKLMAYLGLVPSEFSTGRTTRRGGITRAGNARVRHKLIEGAWTYRLQARPGRTKALHPQEATAGDSGHRLESPVPPHRTISKARSAWKEINCRDNGHRAGNGGVHVGYRPPHHPRTLSAPRHTPNGGREVNGRGISANRFVASFRLTPVVRQE